MYINLEDVDVLDMYSSLRRWYRRHIHCCFLLFYFHCFPRRQLHHYTSYGCFMHVFPGRCTICMFPFFFLSQNEISAMIFISRKKTPQQQQQQHLLNIVYTISLSIHTSLLVFPQTEVSDSRKL